MREHAPFEWPGDAHVGMAGSGELYDACCTTLRRTYRVEPLGIEDPPTRSLDLDLVLLLDDTWDRQRRERWNAWALAQGIPLSSVHLEPGAAIVGPFVLPLEPGCLACADARRLRARSDGPDYARLMERFGPRLSGLGRAWLTPFATEVLHGLLAAQVSSLLGSGRLALAPHNAIIRLTLDRLTIGVHRYLPDPLCERCGKLLDDSREAAIIELVSRRKVSHTTHRVRSLKPERSQLHELYVDGQAGMIRGVHKEGRIVFPSASAPMGLRATHRTEVGYGRQMDYEATQLTAIAEALERYGGIEPGGRRTVVRGSYRELSDDAQDPTSFGLHAEEQYARPGYPYVRYHHDLRCSWVWGYSFARRRPVLIPENYAYYGTVYRRTADQPFVYEISNGCALGGCLEEAILHGILEVAERDAFLLTWYARLAVPEIDPKTAEDSSVPLIVDALGNATGFRIRAFDMTLEHGVPSMWVMAIDERERSGLPKVLCASGSSLHPERALSNALLELAPMASRPPEYYRSNRARVEQMLADPDKVEAMEDHALLNAAPEAFDRFAFLLGQSDAGRSFHEAFPGYYGVQQGLDLLDDLNQTLHRYLATGMDVIVVDQTTPEHALGKFRCVKVVIPGMLPMTFGHLKRRITGLSRLFRVPHELGYAPRPLTEAQLNPYPHPFP